MEGLKYLWLSDTIQSSETRHHFCQESPQYHSAKVQNPLLSLSTILILTGSVLQKWHIDPGWFTSLIAPLLSQHAHFNKFLLVMLLQHWQISFRCMWYLVTGWRKPQLHRAVRFARVADFRAASFFSEPKDRRSFVSVRVFLDTLDILFECFESSGVRFGGKS